MALVLDRVGVSARGGSGCVTREMKIPPAMKAIGAKPEEARSLILFTLGVASPNLDVAAAANLISEGVRRLSLTLPAE